MARVKNGLTRKARHKKVLERAKGYRGRGGSCYRIAHERTEKGMQYAYRDRKAKKGDMRSLWIVRINAAVREHGVKYGEFIAALAKAGIELDRKVLAALAVENPAEFKAVVDQAKRFITAK